MKFGSILSAAVACSVAGVTDAATADQWRGRAIYQVLTDRFARTDGSTTYTCNTQDRKYCGGTWKGITNHLDYIKNMGFTAIWISPITYNIPSRTYYGDAYHGYWQQDLYRLNDHFGTADDLKALSKALHDRGMYLMVDVVPNHFGWNGSSDTVNYSQLHPFNDQKYFHQFCSIVDYGNQASVENCWLGDSHVELPDVNTDDSAVQNVYNTWIKQLIANYSIDGLRIDTVKHVGKPFWDSFQAAAGVYTMGEVFADNPGYTCDYQNHLTGLFNYPLYWPIIEFLNSTSGSSASFLDMADQMKSNCKDISLLGVFAENHDVPRFASQTKDISLAKNVVALSILWDGIPMVYAGQEHQYQGYADPDNREATWLSGYSTQSALYNTIAALNQVRNVAIQVDAGYTTYQAWVIQSDDHTISFRKGWDGNQIVSVISNLGASGSSYSLTLTNTGWAANTVVVEILTCQQYTVQSGGLNVQMAGGAPRIFFPVNKAAGSGICGLTSKKRDVPEARTMRRGTRMIQSGAIDDAE